MTSNIKSKTTTLIYSSEKSELSEKFQLTVECNESFIKMLVEKEEKNNDSFYYIKKDSEEFKNLVTLYKIYNYDLEKIYSSISYLIDEKKDLVSIKEVNDNYLILTLKMFVSGSKEPLIYNIKLLKEKYDKDTLIIKLSERINKLEKEKINLYDKLEEQRKIGILQIYSLVEAAYQLWQWMEKEGYGKSKVHVDSVLLDDFNKDPDEWLKLGDKWNYDIIMFGIWDGNKDHPLKEKAVNAIEAFIKDGGGCILSHGTVGYIWGNSGLNKLRDYYGLKVGKWDKSPYGDYNQQWGYISSKIKITKTGLLTTYPWKIGEIGTVLNVSKTHTTSDAAPEDNVWFELCDGNYGCGKGPDALRKANYSDNFIFQ